VHTVIKINPMYTGTYREFLRGSNVKKDMNYYINRHTNTHRLYTKKKIGRCKHCSQL